MGKCQKLLTELGKEIFSAMDNLIWHYTRITLLNELLDEEKIVR